MNAPKVRAVESNASAPVRKQRGNSLRRHWLSGAFVFVVMGAVGYAGLQIYEADQRLEAARQHRAEVEVELKELRLKNANLDETLQKVTGDEYLELMAKNMGFTRPNEKVYHTGPPSGQ